MGFFDSLGEAVGRKYSEARSDYNNASDRAGRLNDERLINKFKEEDNIARKAAYANELKRRGYGRQDD